MELAKVHPDLRRAVRRVPVLPLNRAWVRRLLRGAQRRLSRPDVVDGVRFEDVAEDGLSLRIYRPEGAASGAGLLWVHGGGLIIGQPSQDDRYCSVTARDLGMVVVSVDYRLAPEHPFPAAADDCLAGWEWFQRSAAELGVDPERIAIGGQSAGGGLAAGLAHRLRDAGGVQPPAQMLYCPMLDDRTGARTELDGVEHWVWNNRLNRIGWSAYLGQEIGGDRVRRYSVAARREDLRGLPPAWIGVGDIDLFHDEDRVYAERLRAADVECELVVVPGAPHGFAAWNGDAPVSRAYLEQSRVWLRDRISV